MTKLNIFVCSVAFSFCTFISPISFGAEPTSEIPAQREFPLSTKIAACENFHGYVCSEAEAAFKLPDDRNRHAFAFSDSFERLLKLKKSFFANIDKEKNLPTRSLQIKSFYKACMNESTAAKNELAALQELKSDLQTIKTPAEFAQYQIANLAKGKQSLLRTGNNPNNFDNKTYDFVLMSSLMTLPDHSYYENKELMADYKNLLIEFFQITSPELKENENKKRAENVIEIEKEFIKIYPKAEIRRQRWSENRQQLQTDEIKKYPNLDLQPLFKQLPDKAYVFDPIPESFDFLNKQMNPSRLNTLKDFYAALHAPMIDDSNPVFFNKLFSFKAKYLGGPVARSARDERCTREAMASFPKEIDQILIKKHFSKFPEAKFAKVAAKMRESIILGLKRNTWLEPKTKEKAIAKIEKAKLYLVQPKTEKEWNFIPVQKYTDDNKIENARLFNQAEYNKEMADIQKETNLTAWHMGPLTVNAYYDASANKFVMPMGILQYPFFNPDGDLIENLGAVGAVIGHELGHGIDDEGSKYDETGKLEQWMTMNDMAEFSKRGQKLIEQFNKAGHNGALTLGENIGDLVGLTFAYNAAFPDGKAKVADQQKLFIAYGRLWCNVSRPKAEEQQLKSDPHALGWARINEQVKHQKAFAEAFSCKAGDKMTLPDAERVSIW